MPVKFLKVIFVFLKFQKCPNNNNDILYVGNLYNSSWYINEIFLWNLLFLKIDFKIDSFGLVGSYKIYYVFLVLFFIYCTQNA